MTAVVLSGGCAATAKDLAMAPINVAEHVVVTAAKLPYESAKIGITSLIDATFGNAEKALRSLVSR